VNYVRAKAPLRISFAGGGTDVPPFPAEEGGCVLSATINRYAWGTLRPREDDHVVIESRDIGTSLRYSSVADVVVGGDLDLAQAAVQRLAGDERGGWDLYLHSDASPGSGLGASSAMVVALVGLFNEWNSNWLSPPEIAALAYQIERVDLAISGGLQDQYAAAFGGFNFIEFQADHVEVTPLNVPVDVLNELEYNLLLVDTRRQRVSSHIISDQVGRYERREPDSVAALRELKRIAGQMRTELIGRRLGDFGALLDEDWQHKKRMSDRISAPELDELYELARRSGALGGKITGAGGGGHMLLYCGLGTKHRVADALEAAGCAVVSFAFELHGLQTWRGS
jgi:D-glycero-alpha-D-manno-heptose-7-phosphate kinase